MLARAGALEHELVGIGRVDTHCVTVRELALEQSQRERVLDQPLQRALERTRTVGRIPAGVGDDLLRVVGELELDAAIGKARAPQRELQLDDLIEMIPRQRLELE